MSAGDAGLDAFARDSWPESLWWRGEELAARRPREVARPSSAQEAAEAIRRASDLDVAIVARGGGSGVLGAAVPAAGALVLDCSGLTSVFELKEDADEPTLRVSAGLLGGEIERRLNARGFSLRHLPASLDVSTPAGWIACLGYGQLSSRYGGIDRQLVSLEALGPSGDPLVLPAAEHLGAEGTLGVITEATFLVRRLPREHRGWGVRAPSLEAGLELAREARRRGAAVIRLYSAVDALASGLSGPPRGHGGGPAALLRRWRLLDFLSPLAGRSWLLVALWEGSAGPAPRGASEEPARRWWERRYQWDSAKLFQTFEEGAFVDTMDVWTPYDRLPEVERAVRRALRGRALSMAHVSHLDDEGACLYVTMAAAAGAREATRALHARAWELAMEAAGSAGARLTHHHGVGLGKRRWLSRCLPPGRLERLSRLRRVIDPRGLLNPDKLRP